MIKMALEYSVPQMASKNANVLTMNITSPQYPHVTADHYSTMIQMEKYCLPFICLLGLLGNTLSTITFLRMPLRRAPCSLYLAARGISDNGFLSSLFMTWVSSTFQLRLSQVTGVCQTIVFLTYVCGCVSIWLCVFVTFENFLLIKSPSLYRRFSSDMVSKVSIAVLVFLATALYHISLWIVTKDCSHNPEFATVTHVLVYSDTLLTLVIPTGIICVLLSVITFKVVNIIRIRKMHASLIKYANGYPITKTIKPIAKITKMLFVVSLTFFALNVPSHVIRLHLLIGTFRNGYKKASSVQQTLQTVFQIFYYLSFSVSIIVYGLFGSNFRSTFARTFLRQKRAMCTRFVQTEAVNLVPRRPPSFSRLESIDTNQCLLNTEDNRSSP